MLTLYQKGQIQRELEGEVSHTELFVLQYPHLLVPEMKAAHKIFLHTHTSGIRFLKNKKSKRILNKYFAI